jgi:hypothetical protein
VAVAAGSLSLSLEVTHLRAAAWIVIAFLSGMRDEGVRELGRDCAFTEPADHGRLRYKLRGRVYKGALLWGEQADRVVLEVVHQAVDVLLQLNDDPPTRWLPWRPAVRLRPAQHPTPAAGQIPQPPQRVVQYPDSLCVPNDVAGPDQDEPRPTRPAPPARAGAPGVPWAFKTRQFWRNLAWKIRISGSGSSPTPSSTSAKQYKRARHVMFSGYAGTSASGFAAEVATEEAVARLDYAEDIYRYWNDGGRSQGGASARIDAEFARIRRELGDLPGVVSSPTRLRRKLAHLTKTLYPGILNDCFH